MTIRMRVKKNKLSIESTYSRFPFVNYANIVQMTIRHVFERKKNEFDLVTQINTICRYRCGEMRNFVNQDDDDE